MKELSLKAAAAELGRRGGQARVLNTSAEQRKEIARMGADAIKDKPRSKRGPYKKKTKGKKKRKGKSKRKSGRKTKDL